MTPHPPLTADLCRDMLAHLSPNCTRLEWFEIAAALNDALGEAGEPVFVKWSESGEKAKPGEPARVYRSAAKPGKVAAGTLVHRALAAGFRFPKDGAAAARPPAPTPAELQAAAQAKAERLAREQAERDKRQRDAAAEAARQWAEASEAGAELAGYLMRKGIKPYGVRVNAAGAVLVPMRDAAGELWNLQAIRPAKPADGGPDKLFLKGGRVNGLMHWCGTPNGADVLLVAEGLATATSIHEATARPACAVFTAGNMPHAVRALRGRYPAALIVVCGDDDRHPEAPKRGNAGREKATEAAKLAHGVAVFPEGLPDGASDWNDTHARAGLGAVREPIEAAIEAAQAAPPSKAAQTPPDARKNAPAGRKRAARGSADDDATGAAAGFDRYRVEDGALWFDAPGDDGGPGRPVKVCGALHVTAWARDANDNGAALLLEFDTPFRAGRRWLMPLSMLAGDGTAYRAELLNQGFMVPTDAKRRALLTAYLQSRKPDELVRLTDRTGWLGRCYVMPRETLGDDGGERILFQSDPPTEGTFGQRGTLDQWRERIGRLCVGNSRLTFAASCAFAGPLLAWAAGTDGGGVHLMGDSSCGKTTALKVAASVWGGRDYLQRWRATDNGLEGMAAQHSDALLCLDELAQLDARVAGEAAYMLANGQGKSRAGRTGAARPRLAWRLLFLSAGEIGLAEHMGEANKRTRAGQELRMIDLAADAGAGLGIFETRHEHDSGGALAQHLARATESTFGTPGRAWLVHLTGNTEGLSRTLRERMDALEAQFVPELASGQVQRVGRRFALIAAAGEMATEAGITAWPAGEATSAARRCFNAWTAVRTGGIGMSEDAQMLRQLRGWFGLHGEARFTHWDRADDDHAPKTMNRAGWRKPVKTTTGLDELIGWEWFVLPDVFRGEACRGFSDRAALRLLDERGHLHRESPRGFGCRASPPGAEKCSVYRIKSSILSESDE